MTQQIDNQKAEVISPEAAKKGASSLSFGNLYNHFFLIHDFLHKVTKVKGNNAQFFDLQI